MRVSRVGVNKNKISPEGSELKKTESLRERSRWFWRERAAVAVNNWGTQFFVPANFLFVVRVALSGLVIFICYPGLLPWAEMSRVVGAQSLFPPNKKQT